MIDGPHPTIGKDVLDMITECSPHDNEGPSKTYIMIEGSHPIGNDRRSTLLGPFVNFPPRIKWSDGPFGAHTWKYCWGGRQLTMALLATPLYIAEIVN